MVYSIIAQITGSGPFTAIADARSILVKWTAITEAGSDIAGERAFTVVLPLTDTEIEANVRQQLADHVSQISGHAYIAADVLGCKL
jgi:hypothetical protein